jgi:hypothetical protein
MAFLSCLSSRQTNTARKGQKLNARFRWTSRLKCLRIQRWRPSPKCNYPLLLTETDSSGSERPQPPTDQTESGYKSKRSPPSATNKRHACHFPFRGSQAKAWGSGSPHAPRATGLGTIAETSERSDERQDQIGANGPSRQWQPMGNNRMVRQAEQTMNIGRRLLNHSGSLINAPSRRFVRGRFSARGYGRPSSADRGPASRE